MAHPAQDQVSASRKRRMVMVEGSVRPGRNRPGKGLVGGASENGDEQSTSQPLEPRQRLGVPLLSAPGK